MIEDDSGISHSDGPHPAVPAVPYVSKDVMASQRGAAAALAGGLIASGDSSYPATPAGAVQAYQDVFDELERLAAISPNIV